MKGWCDDPSLSVLWPSCDLQLGCKIPRAGAEAFHSASPPSLSLTGLAYAWCWASHSGYSIPSVAQLVSPTFHKLTSSPHILHLSSRKSQWRHSSSSLKVSFLLAVGKYLFSLFKGGSGAFFSRARFPICPQIKVLQPSSPCIVDLEFLSERGSLLWDKYAI